MGAVLEGYEGLRTFSALSGGQNPDEVFVATMGAAVSAFLMTVLGVPVSTSQAMVGSIIGVGLANGRGVITTGLGKVFICWVGTPIGTLLVGFLLYIVLARVLKKLELNFFQTDSLFRWGLLFSGIYGSYALGANNVANVTGVYVGAGMMNESTAAWVGGLSIAAGVLTYSKSVMLTVGKSLIPLNGLGALTAVLSQAIVVHFYSWVGVPVSTSQAIVGAVIAVGLINGRSIRMKTLLKIINGWFMTPVISCIFTWVLVKIFLVS
jgi:PiT family inorganic phosphate transporter